MILPLKKSALLTRTAISILDPRSTKKMNKGTNKEEKEGKSREKLSLKGKLRSTER